MDVYLGVWYPLVIATMLWIATLAWNIPPPPQQYGTLHKSLGNSPHQLHLNEQALICQLIIFVICLRQFRPIELHIGA